MVPGLTPAPAVGYSGAGLSANGPRLDVQQGTDLGRGLAGFDEFLGLSAYV